MLYDVQKLSHTHTYESLTTLRLVLLVEVGAIIITRIVTTGNQEYDLRTHTYVMKKSILLSRKYIHFTEKELLHFKVVYIISLI